MMQEPGSTRCGLGAVMLNDVLCRLNSTIFVPSVPPLKNQSGTGQAAPLLNVPPVPLVSPQNAGTLEQGINKTQVKQSLLQIVTCRNCTHFKSFNKHGGGAGHCSARVHTAGYCRWADTIHQCENYKLNRIEAKT